MLSEFMAVIIAISKYNNAMYFITKDRDGADGMECNDTWNILEIVEFTGRTDRRQNIKESSS